MRTATIAVFGSIIVQCSEPEVGCCFFHLFSRSSTSTTREDNRVRLTFSPFSWIDSRTSLRSISNIWQVRRSKRVLLFRTNAFAFLVIRPFVMNIEFKVNSSRLLPKLLLMPKLDFVKILFYPSWLWLPRRILSSNQNVAKPSVWRSPPISSKHTALFHVASILGNRS